MEDEKLVFTRLDARIQEEEEEEDNEEYEDGKKEEVEEEGKHRTQEHRTSR